MTAVLCVLVNLSLCVVFFFVGCRHQKRRDVKRWLLQIFQWDIDDVRKEIELLQEAPHEYKDSLGSVERLFGGGFCPQDFGVTDRGWKEILRSCAKSRAAYLWDVIRSGDPGNEWNRSLLVQEFLEEKCKAGLKEKDFGVCPTRFELMISRFQNRTQKARIPA